MSRALLTLLTHRRPFDSDSRYVSGDGRRPILIGCCAISLFFFFLFFFDELLLSRLSWDTEPSAATGNVSREGGWSRDAKSLHLVSIWRRGGGTCQPHVRVILHEQRSHMSQMCVVKNWWFIFSSIFVQISEKIWPESSENSAHLEHRSGSASAAVLSQSHLLGRGAKSYKPQLGKRCEFRSHLRVALFFYWCQDSSAAHILVFWCPQLTGTRKFSFFSFILRDKCMRNVRLATCET